MLHTHVASKIEDINEMIDAHAYEMQCNYGSQTPEVLQDVSLSRLPPLPRIVGTLGRLGGLAHGSNISAPGSRAPRRGRAQA
jgi:hypothetical protein